MQPVPASQREDFLDGLRGLALWGILTVNLEHLAGVALYAAQNPTQGAFETGRWIIAFVFSGKFYTLFSILFGLGLALQYRRFVAAGRDPLPLLRRRLGVLLGFGALHGIFLFDGDILGSYALLGWFALRYLPEPSLRTVGALLAVGYAIAFGLALLWASEGAPLNPAYYNQSYGAVTAERLESWLLYNLPFSALIGFELVGLFVLGMWLAPRWQSFSKATLWQAVFWGLAVGLVVNSYNAQYVQTQPLRGLGGLCFALAFAALLRLAWPYLGPLQALKYAGRMPLTNYILQSAVMGTVFYGYGLGLYGQLNPIWFAPLAAGFVVLQVLLSRWWLSMHPQGPLEALWRRLTYGP